MKTPKHETHPGARAASLMHWLALVSGLAVLTVERIDVPEKVVPIWIGGVIGTAFGQFLARRRFRLWLTLVIIPNTMFFAALLSAPFWLPFGRLRGDELGMTMLSFAPAALSGYLALGDRTALAGIWFPVVLWTLSVLDHAGGPGTADSTRFLLLGGPVLMIVAAFYANETRRVALWSGGRAVEKTVLREAPTATVARGAWTLMIGAAALAITSWLAPRLWQTKDTMTQRSVAGFEGGGAGGLPCCPEVAAHGDQVQEYFAPLDTYARPATAFPNGCAACGETTVAASGTSVKGAAEAPGTGGTFAPDKIHGGSARSGASGRSSDDAASSAHPNDADAVDRTDRVWNAPRTTDTTPPVPTTTPVAAADPVTNPSRPRPPATARPSRTAALATPPGHDKPRLGDPTTRVAPAPHALDAHVLFFLAVLLTMGVLLNVASRPLRRAIAVRHLSEPIWPEAIDQRVSNLWQLALVGLRDGGFVATPGEGPSAIARRSGLAEMETCATVLERARHGVRLDARDIDTMKRAATATYATARDAAGVTGRALGQLRWPLV